MDVLFMHDTLKLSMFEALMKVRSPLCAEQANPISTIILFALSFCFPPHRTLPNFVYYQLTRPPGRDRSNLDLRPLGRRPCPLNAVPLPAMGGRQIRRSLWLLTCNRAERGCESQQWSIEKLRGGNKAGSRLPTGSEERTGVCEGNEDVLPRGRRYRGIFSGEFEECEGICVRGKDGRWGLGELRALVEGRGIAGGGAGGLEGAVYE
jgi:hypothetical protein